MSDIIKKPEFKHILNDTKVEFRVSLDSHIESIHDSFRGKGTFKKLIGNIEYLCQHKCRLSVKSVITKSNIKDLKPMLYFLKERNISNFAYSALYNLGSAEDKFYSENYISNSDILLEILNILEEDPSLAKLLRPNILRHVLDSLFIKNPYILSKMYLHVNYDGNIYPQDQLIYDKFCLGNIYKLNNDIFGDIVSRFKDIKLRYEINRKECLECDFYPFCVKGNYGELYKKDEKLLECFPNCDDLKNLYLY
ncbi:SPASM domain-containing protein [Caloramator sp. mosi_1]|uniref:SPASM domain-containing protein n=1 Tax=Caloramator sp. mosi_1 TaxID=3023090 RepID=UPI002361D607|nr:SPASM domain-containing protein [Caloramator sp. mosi_1]WDC83350.1 SPASM domain-containing protein [Caloramator sp. mosi_1]